MIFRPSGAAALLCAAVTSSMSCTASQGAAASPGAASQPDDPKAFVKRVNEELKDLVVRASTAEWIKSTYITDDSERNAAWANEAVMAYLTDAIKKAAQFKDVKTDPETERMLYLLRVSSALPAPSDPAKRRELAQIAAKLEGIYGKGKYCGKDGKGKCRDLLELEKVMAESRRYDELLDAWTGWHSVAPEMRPLYVDLHCYVRAQLQKKYGKERVPDGGPLPAHLLGNMWAQEWPNVYSLVEPYKGASSTDVTAAIRRQKRDWKWMVKTSED